nr:unnamed protein product [Callosobruchus chinensis]
MPQERLSDLAVIKSKKKYERN